MSVDGSNGYVRFRFPSVSMWDKCRKCESRSSRLLVMNTESKRYGRSCVLLNALWRLLLSLWADKSFYTVATNEKSPYYGA